MNTRIIFCFLLFLTNLVRAQVATPPEVSTGQAAPAVAAQPSPSPVRFDDLGVFHVQNERRPSKNPSVDPCVARRDDIITVYVKHLNAWLKDLQLHDRLPKDAKLQDMIPFVDDVPLPGIHPEQFWTDPRHEDSVADPQISTLRFTLSRTDSSKEAWSRILDSPHFSRPMKVSIGFENGEAVPTFVLPTASKSENQFTFILIPPFRFWLGVVLIVGAFIIFVHLARTTTIIRDTNSPLRPDKNWPYSLSRTQAAFWFFLVIGAFFFLWVIIGDTDTLNPSVLALIGISAATTVASVFVDSSKPPAMPSESDLPAVDLSQPRKMICQQIITLAKAAHDELAELERVRGQIDPAAETALAANAEAQTVKKAHIDDLERQLEYFRRPAWKALMFDLLTEKNDDNRTAVEFHRFQILVWTIVLGIMFVANVYNQLAMPQFSATLLGLLGISAGTYVGLKVPEPDRSKTG